MKEAYVLCLVVLERRLCASSCVFIDQYEKDFAFGKEPRQL